MTETPTTEPPKKTNPRRGAPRWVIKLIKAVISAAIVLGTAYWTLFAAGPRVTVYYTYEEGYWTLPSQTRHLLLLLEGLRELAHREQLTFTSPKDKVNQLREAIAKIPPLVPRTPNTQIFDDSIDLLSNLSDFAPRIHYSQVVTLTVINSGNRTARDISIIPNSPGRFEIWPDGFPYAPESEDYTETKITIPFLQPNEHKTVTLWPDNHLDRWYPPVNARHADGIATVKPDTIIQDDTSFLFKVPHSILLILGSIIAATAVCFIFHRVFGAATED